MKKAHRPERRFITDAKDLPSIEKLGPLESLLGTWKTPGWPCGKGDEKPGPEGPHATGWNMIALPFDEAEFNYRVLMNQYCEELHFGFVDDNVPNRGLAGIVNDGDETDQFVYTIDYLQKIHIRWPPRICQAAASPKGPGVSSLPVLPALLAVISTMNLVCGSTWGTSEPRIRIFQQQRGW